MFMLIVVSRIIWIVESHCRRWLQVERYAYGVRNMDFDSSLAPYDLPHHATWWHLSNFINQAVINRLRKRNPKHFFTHFHAILVISFLLSLQSLWVAIYRLWQKLRWWKPVPWQKQRSRCMNILLSFDRSFQILNHLKRISLAAPVGVSILVFLALLNELVCQLLSLQLWTWTRYVS